MNVKSIYTAVKKYAQVVGGIPADAEISEVCDFGSAYGFLFDVGYVFSNVYWCYDKKLNKITTFIPSQDMNQFKNRDILPLSILN